LGLNVGGGGGPALEALAREGDDASYKFPVPLRRRKDCDFSYAGLKTAVRLAIERDLGVGGVGADDGAFTKVYSRGGDSEEEEDEEEVDSDEDSNSSATTTTTRRRLPSPEEEDAATRRTRANIAASFQRVAVTHLTERTSRAVEWANDLLDDGETLSCVVVAGGVASNAVVRERLSEVASRCALPLVTPPPRWCVDNGVMVAWAGVERLALGLSEAPCTEAQVAASPSSANRRDVPTFPRWPLGERDDRATGHVKSAKTARIAAPLTGAGGDGSARFPGVVAPGVVEA
jgi:N6-L-threonylcarbamoyladenine synthase